MRYLTLALMTLAFAIGITFVSDAKAACNPNLRSISLCKASCNMCAIPDRPACFATCASHTFGGGGGGTTPVGVTCGDNEHKVGNSCECDDGFERYPKKDGPCVAECLDGEFRDADTGECRSCGEESDPCCVAEAKLQKQFRKQVREDLEDIRRRLPSDAKLAATEKRLADEVKEAKDFRDRVGGMVNYLIAIIVGLGLALLFLVIILFRQRKDKPAGGGRPNLP